MSGYLRAQVVLPNINNAPADAVMNTWHFDGDSETPTRTRTQIAEASADKLIAFYQALGPTLFPTTMGLTGEVTFYDLADPEPRAPFYSETFVVLKGSGVAYPSEVALVLSFQGAQESGQSKARRRGRIYLGPLPTSAGTAATGGVRPTQSLVDLIAAQADILLSNTTDGHWAVFSPTTRAQGGTLDEAFHDVTDGWIDNAFDTQRRRGLPSTSRTLWS